VAFGDVVVDGLMVDKGQPRGLTGRLQAVQWGCIWTGSILAYAVGGYLSGKQQQQLGLLICGLVSLVSFATAAFGVRETRDPTLRPNFRQAIQELKIASTSRGIFPVAAFLFLWNFNPFATNVQYVFMTRDIGISEEYYGVTQAFGAAAAMLASFAYGFYCRRVPRSWLVHFSIAGGVIATVAFWGLHDQRSAMIIAVVTFAANATATMVQLDFSAQCVPPAVAGTAFALLMSLSNFGTQLSASLGGHLYERAKAAWGHVPAFHALVAVGATTTAACWLLTPLLVKPTTPEGTSDEPVEQ
jgi:predicted MFS family arabinose efflux permease